MTIPLNAWRFLPSLRDPGKFDAWPRRLLVNACRHELRRHRPAVVEITTLDLTGGDPDPGVGLANRDQLERGFRRLDADQRAVIVLHFYEGHSLTDVGAILDAGPDPPGRCLVGRAGRQARAHRRRKRSLGVLPELVTRRSPDRLRSLARPGAILRGGRRQRVERGLAGRSLVGRRTGDLVPGRAVHRRERSSPRWRAEPHRRARSGCEAAGPDVRPRQRDGRRLAADRALTAAANAIRSATDPRAASGRGGRRGSARAATACCRR